MLHMEVAYAEKVHLDGLGLEDGGEKGDVTALRCPLRRGKGCRQG